MSCFLQATFGAILPCTGRTRSSVLSHTSRCIENKLISKDTPILLLLFLETLSAAKIKQCFREVQPNQRCQVTQLKNLSLKFGSNCFVERSECAEIIRLDRQHEMHKHCRCLCSSLKHAFFGFFYKITAPSPTTGNIYPILSQSPQCRKNQHLTSASL